MARLFDQYLAFYNNINLPDGIKNWPSRFKIWPNTKETLKKQPKTCAFCPSSKIAPNLITLKVAMANASLKMPDKWSLFSNALYFQYRKLPSVVITFPSRKQCDQMAILIFPYLPICSNENVPNSIQKLPKKVQHFAKS